MSKRETWEERYRSGKTGWDLGKPDENLMRVVSRTPIAPAKTLEIGCGTGTNAVWLAKQGFKVTGLDIADLAIEKARERATDENAACEFLLGDFMVDPIPASPFGLVVDIACFHAFGEVEERVSFAGRVASHLEPGGFWLSIIGNADDPPRDEGPPRRSATDIVLSVEPHFEILSLVSTHFESKGGRRPRAWSCLMKKRDGEYLATH